MPSDFRKQQDRAQDEAVAETFPASDPPSTMGGEGGARAVPAEAMMGSRGKPHDAVTLRRRFPGMEAAKLALESLVRDGPVDRNLSELVARGREVELLLHVSEEDCPRIRGLLAHA